jgi:hypothetical protein
VSTDRDVERVVRSWLDEGVNVVPERVLNAVTRQLPATPQRRVSWLARRTPTLNTYARLGLVAAAVLAVVIVGIGLFGKSLNIGTAPSPTPSPSPSASASPAAASNPLAGTWVTPVVTCAQQIATIEAAGYTVEQMTSVGFDPTCATNGTNQYSVVFDGLPAAATIRSATVYDGADVASTHIYRLTSDTSFELGGSKGSDFEWCVTVRYLLEGDQLTIQKIDPGCSSTENGPLLDQVALTGILETSPFTRQP